MNPAQHVKWLNRLALLAMGLMLLLLLGWAVVQVFGLRVFTRSLTQAVVFGGVGLFAVLGACLILNVMLNLSRMADSLAALHKDTATVGMPASGGDSKRWLALMGAAAVLMVAGLFAGDAHTRSVKKQRLIDTAQSVMQERSARLDAALTLPDSLQQPALLQNLARQLALIEQTDRHVDHIGLLLPARYLGEPVVVQVNRNWSNLRQDATVVEQGMARVELGDLLFKTSADQRQWLFEAFAGRQPQPLYRHEGGHYQLFYPVKIGPDWVVLYFDDRQAYGKVSG